MVPLPLLKKILLGVQTKRRPARLNCKTNVPGNDDICKLFEQEICYTVILMLVRRRWNPIKGKNDLIPAPKQIIRMIEHNKRTGWNAVEGEEVCIAESIPRAGRAFSIKL